MHLISEKSIRQIALLDDDFLTAVMSSLDDLIFVFNDEGEYLHIFCRDESKLFFPKVDLIGRKLSQVMSAVEAKPFVDALHACFSENLPQTIEYSGKPYNQMWFRARLNQVQVPPDQPRLVTMAIQDITESKRLRDDLEVLRAAQINSAKLASLGEMAGGVAHEINNPLAIIQNKTLQIEQMLQDSPVPRSRVQTELTKISETCTRIARIIKGLKAFARNADADPFMPTDLRTIVDDALSLCQQRFRNHHVEVRVSIGGAPVAESRATQLVQVLVNLLNNAYDAVVGQPHPWIEITLSEGLDSVQIAVTDSGPGIPQALRSKVMEPFFTTKGVGSGTGLGLSISRGILEQHGGVLSLDETNQHTSFILKLPRNQPKVKNAANSVSTTRT